MDPTRFDSITRALITPTSQPTRRAVMLLMGSGLLARVLPAISEVAAKGNKKKQKRKDKERKICQNKFGPGLGTFCRGTAGTGCFDLLTDPAHCGGCANACAAGQTCVGGRCTGASTTCTPTCAGKACGADNGCGGICANGSCPAGQTCRSDGACIAGGCNPACGFNSVCQNGTCAPAPNRCPEPFVCSGFGGDAPVCGNVAGPGGDVGPCGCYRSTENNYVCVNEVDADGDDIPFQDLIPCNSTQDCREGPGLNYWCRAVNTNAQNGLICGSSVGRCWPTCDNPDVFRESPQGRAEQGAPQRRKSARRQKGRRQRS